MLQAKVSTDSAELSSKSDDRVSVDMLCLLLRYALDRMCVDWVSVICSFSSAHSIVLYTLVYG